MAPSPATRCARGGSARVRSALVLLFLAASCSEDDGREPNAPRPTTGDIAGRVTTTAGEPVIGARVGTMPATAIAFTDAQGGYRLADVDPGSYAVVAVAEDWAKASARRWSKLARPRLSTCGWSREWRPILRARRADWCSGEAASR